MHLKYALFVNNSLKMSVSNFGQTMSDVRGYLRPEEIRTLIESTRNLRDRTILWLLWATGCRLSELLMLKVEDIALEDRVLYMWTLKRREQRRYQRIVLVDDATIDLIKKYMKTYSITKGALIRISKRRVRQIVYETGVAAGIPRVGTKKIHPHHFRHSHCVAWVRANPSMEGLRKLQQRLGHASIATTAHYLQFAFSEQQLEVDSVLGEILSPGISFRSE